MGSKLLTRSRNRPFKPKEFLKLANRLINDRKYDDDCRSRTAIGRAYYSAFLYIKSRLEGWGQSFNDDHRIHSEVVDALMDRNRTLGSQLENLRQARVDSDYHMNVPIDKNTGEYYVKLSQQIILEISIQ